MKCFIFGCKVNALCAKGNFPFLANNVLFVRFKPTNGISSNCLHYLCRTNEHNKEMKEPQRLTLKSIYERYSATEGSYGKAIYSRNGIVVGIGLGPQLFKHFIKTGCPYLVEEYRCGIVARGEVHGIINLKDVYLSTGTLAFITPGTIIEPIQVSNDFLLIGMGIPNDLFFLSHNNSIPPLFNGQIQDGQHKVGAEDFDLICNLYNTLWHVVKSTTAGRETILSLISAITWHFNAIFSQNGVTSKAHANNTQNLFDRFIALVNHHSKEQRQLSFYADKLCITQRYLSTAVRLASGVTAKCWIDRSVMAHAKVMLRHSNRQISIIADELHFANTSFFCKYFKRLADQTPEEYRKGGFKGKNVKE